MRGVAYVLSLGAIACVTDPPMNGPKQGELGGPCFDDGRCKEGLMCVVPNKCVLPDGGMDAASGDAATADAGPCAKPGMNPPLGWYSGDQTLASVKGLLPPLMVTMPAYQAAEVNQGFLLGAPNSNPEVSVPGLAETNFTVEFWMRADAISSVPQYIVEFATPGATMTDGWSVVISTGLISFSVGGAGSAGAQNPPQGKFIHFAGVLTPSGTYAYLNGTLAMNMPGTGGLQALNGKLRIGQSARNNAMAANQFVGVVDELAVYGEALSASDIKAIADAGPSGKCR